MGQARTFHGAGIVVLPSLTVLRCTTLTRLGSSSAPRASRTDSLRKARATAPAGEWESAYSPLRSAVGRCAGVYTGPGDQKVECREFFYLYSKEYSFPPNLSTGYS